MSQDGAVNKMQTLDDSVLEVLRVTKRELRTLVQQRADIMRRIGRAKQAVLGLANLFGDAVLDQELLELMDHRPNNRQRGFTRACRILLMETDRSLNTSEICEGLRRKFPDLAARHKDLLASSTTVLNRLVAYGEVLASRGRDGRRVWKWSAQGDIEIGGVGNPPDVSIAENSLQ